MSEIRYTSRSTNLKLGADGFLPSSPALPDDGCCPQDICLNTCDLICSFIDLLPTGPMWDSTKQEAVAYFQGGGDYDPCNPYCLPDALNCPSMVVYGIYVARVLQDAVYNILWPVIRESNPATAVTTLDSWLERYQWEDCYRSGCRSYLNSSRSPYWYLNECDLPEYCPVTFDDDFECALKHNILQALIRLSRGVIPNIDGINWVIAPLGAKIRPRQPLPDEVECFLNGEGDDDEISPCFCAVAELEICQTGDIAACPPLQCTEQQGTIKAQRLYKCEGQAPVLLYPGVLAAECIVRASLPRSCREVLFRRDDIVQTT